MRVISLPSRTGGVGGGFLIAYFHHSLLQNLHVGFITQVCNETALFGSQQITCTTNVEVLHSDMNSTAQITELL